MKVGDIVKRKRGRRSHWIGKIIKEEPQPIGKKFLIQWLRRSTLREQCWEQELSLEVIDGSR